MAALFKTPKIPSIPPSPQAEQEPESPVMPMPDPDDPVLKARKKRATAIKNQEGGSRLSTLLSDFEPLG